MSCWSDSAQRYVRCSFEISIVDISGYTSPSLFRASRLIERFEWQTFLSLSLSLYTWLCANPRVKSIRGTPFFFARKNRKAKFPFFPLRPVCALSRGSRVEYIDNRASCAGTGYLCRHVFSILPIACLLFEAKSN